MSERASARWKAWSRRVRMMNSGFTVQTIRVFALPTQAAIHAIASPKRTVEMGTPIKSTLSGRFAVGVTVRLSRLAASAPPQAPGRA